MLNLTVEHGAPQGDRSLRFLFKRLQGGPKTTALATPVSKARATLLVKMDALADAELDTQCATVEIAVLTEELGDAFRPLSRGLDALVNGDSHDPRWRLLYAQTPSVALESGHAEAFVQGVLEVLTTDPQFKSLQVHGKAIAAGLANLQGKEKERAQRQAKEVAARAALDTALIEACDVHNKTEPKLVLALGTKKKSVIDSYFLPVRRVKAKAPVVPPPA